MRGIQRLSTITELQQLITLHSHLSQIQLTKQADDIKWRFTTSCSYSAQLAYLAQFSDSFTDHVWDSLWSTKVEPKCKFFRWLILQNKLWATDCIIKHDGQSNLICQICHTHPESALHMIVKCPTPRVSGLDYETSSMVT
jgi:hypothetical protein